MLLKELYKDDTLKISKLYYALRIYFFNLKKKSYEVYFIICALWECIFITVFVEFVIRLIIIRLEYISIREEHIHVHPERLAWNILVWYDYLLESKVYASIAHSRMST